MWLTRGSDVAVKKSLQFLPRAFCFFTKDYDLVLAFIEVQTKTRFHVAFAASIVRGRDVIDVDEKGPALGMGELDEFHLITSKQKFVAGVILTAGYSRRSISDVDVRAGCHTGHGTAKRQKGDRLGS